jgi:hypothetical protein
VRNVNGSLPARPRPEAVVLASSYRPASAVTWQPDLTARRFVDLGRTESMICRHGAR